MRKILSGLMLFMVLVCLIYGSNPKDYTQWWIHTYGDYANSKGKEDWRVKEALGVFERVCSAAEKIGPCTPRLFIINSDEKPYALALPDGGIIISKKTLDICYKNPKEKGDKYMAFILGHELAHLANKDFIHRQAFLAVHQYGGEKADKIFAKHFNLADPDKAKELRQKELMADSMGVRYAFMAGYDISSLFNFNKDSDFFSYWVNQTGIRKIYDADPRYPSLKDRLEFIRAQLKAVAQRLELFKAGVLLYQKGSCHDSAAAFIEFAKIYPSREVFNNIGACYFNLALIRLLQIHKETYYQFRISTSIDYTTSAEAIIQLRGDENYLQDTVFSQYIDKAENYFKTAVERDRHNTSSRCNLAAVSILKKEYARAQAECDLILKQDPKNIHALNNKAIAFYYYGQKHALDTTQKAIQILQEAVKQSPDNIEVLYNLASLKEKRERLAGAKHYWKKYLEISPRDNYYNYVCSKLKEISRPAGRTAADEPPALPAGVRIGEDISTIEKKWGKGNIKIGKYKLGSEGDENRRKKDESDCLIDMKVIVKDNLRIFVLDGMVEMVENSVKSDKNVPDVLKQFGEPGDIVRHTSGNFYVYKNKGFSFKEVNGKVQTYIWFEKSF